MRLGFDLDEVVVNLADGLSEHIKGNYGVDCSIENFVNYGLEDAKFSDDKEFNDRIIHETLQIVVDPVFQSSCKPIEGAPETLRELKRSGHELFFISARPLANKKATLKWMNKYDIPFDSVKLIDRKENKGWYGASLQLDMFVDDLEQHLISMWRFKDRWRKGLLLYDSPWNANYVAGEKFKRVYKRVYNWKEILRHVGIQNR